MTITLRRARHRHVAQSIPTLSSLNLKFSQLASSSHTKWFKIQCLKIITGTIPDQLQVVWAPRFIDNHLWRFFSFVQIALLAGFCGTTVAVKANTFLLPYGDPERFLNRLPPIQFCCVLAISDLGAKHDFEIWAFKVFFLWTRKTPLRMASRGSDLNIKIGNNTQEIHHKAWARL